MDVNSSKNNNRAGRPATEETIITAGTDPRKANDSNNIGHSSVSSNSRGSRIIMGC